MGLVSFTAIGPLLEIIAYSPKPVSFNPPHLNLNVAPPTAPSLLSFTYDTATQIYLKFWKHLDLVIMHISVNYYIFWSFI
jgi:hypothetical protein